MPFTVPDFEPSAEQLENMARLSEFFHNYSFSSASRYNITLAELYREKRRFSEAQQTILRIQKEDEGITSKLIAKLIQEKQPALIRYRM